MRDERVKSLAKALFFVAVIVSVVLAIFNCIERISGAKNLKSITKYTENDNGIEENKVVNAQNDENKAPFVLHKQGRGAVCIEQSTKRILFEDGAHDKCYPASTTKILTALVALENLELDRIVTVPAEAQGVEGSSLYLKAGQKITVEDLLLGLMLRSGNDAAVTLATETCGDVKSFAKLMNEKARSVGAVNSHFSNPHGLDDKTHYTTAYDMALITANAYENEDFCRIVNTKQAKIEIDGEPCYIANKNKLLKTYEGANGVKTGYTKKSGRCFVGGAFRDGMQVISVVFNHGDMWNDTVRMLDFCFEYFEMTPVEQALLSDGKNVVEWNAGALEAQDWTKLRFPLRKDGSEKLVAA